jgi:hypothetical protein
MKINLGINKIRKLEIIFRKKEIMIMLGNYFI